MTTTYATYSVVFASSLTLAEVGKALTPFRAALHAAGEGATETNSNFTTYDGKMMVFFHIKETTHNRLWEALLEGTRPLGRGAKPGYEITRRVTKPSKRPALVEGK